MSLTESQTTQGFVTQTKQELRDFEGKNRKRLKFIRKRCIANAKIDNRVKASMNEADGIAKVAMAYSMKAQISYELGNLDGALDNISISIGIIVGEISPRETSFWDLLYD